MQGSIRYNLDPVSAMKKGNTTILLACSPRKEGNTDTAAEIVRNALAEQGAAAETVALHDYDIQRCRGCLGCQLGKPCPITDDFPALWERVKLVQTLVLFIPVYWCAPPGLMKDFIDRTVTAFQEGGVLAGKTVHLVSIAQSAGFDPQEKMVSQWISWLGGPPLKSKLRLIAFHSGELAGNANAARKLKKLAESIAG